MHSERPLLFRLLHNVVANMTVHVCQEVVSSPGDELHAARQEAYVQHAGVVTLERLDARVVSKRPDPHTGVGRRGRHALHKTTMTSHSMTRRVVHVHDPITMSTANSIK